MRMIVGLGNPGTKHARQRHNIGFMAVDAIFRRHSFSPMRKKFKAEIADGEISGEKVILVKPQTFMNLSGEAVGEAMRFYKIKPTHISVFYDELDLAAGKVRIKTGGGHGGHNGIKSLDAHCGKDYKRIRLGIDHPGHKERVTGHVLGDFSKEDYKWVDPLLNAIGDNIDMLIEGKDSSFMNKLALVLGNEAPLNKSADKSANKSNQQKNQNAKQGGSKNQSHIHQARKSAHTKIQNNAPKSTTQEPQSNQMTDMLKKLFGQEDK